MKKYFFFVLFGALYSTTVAQNLPTKIFKLDYFGNKTLLLEGETSFVEAEQLVAFLISIRESQKQLDALSDFNLIFSDSLATLTYRFFNITEADSVKGI